MRLDLILMHGCGNRFAVVDEDRTFVRERHKSSFVLAVARQTDVHGVLFVAADQRPRMRIFDRDGSEATMCGNGLRCAARYLHDRHAAPGSAFTVETLEGPKPVRVEEERVTVEMGPARQYRRLTADRHFVFTGIPHLVVLCGRMSVDTARVEGRRLRHDRALAAALGHPEGVHVNFVAVGAAGALELFTYEAGVEDVTPACGTGSTAAAAVCARVGAASLPVRVCCLGGELVIDGHQDALTMVGPAEYLVRPDGGPAALDSRGAGADSCGGGRGAGLSPRSPAAAIAR